LNTNDGECERQRLKSIPRSGLGTGSIPNPNEVLEDELLDDDDTPLEELEDETRSVFVQLLSDHEPRLLLIPDQFK